MIGKAFSARCGTLAVRERYPAVAEPFYGAPICTYALACASARSSLPCYLCFSWRRNRRRPPPAGSAPSAAASRAYPAPTAFGARCAPALATSPTHSAIACASPNFATSFTSRFADVTAALTAMTARVAPPWSIKNTMAHARSTKARASLAATSGQVKPRSQFWRRATAWSY